LRERARLRKQLQACKQLLPASARARMPHRQARPWAFSVEQRFIASRAALTRKSCSNVEARHTSQACPRCGSAGQRHRPGSPFAGQDPKYYDTLRADPSAPGTRAGERPWSGRTGSARGGFQPSAARSGDRARAARRQRHAQERGRAVPGSFPFPGAGGPLLLPRNCSPRGPLCQLAEWATRTDWTLPGRQMRGSTRSRPPPSSDHDRHRSVNSGSR
jgi:hypothetical protein